jgi:HK97 family phage prohead protease
METAVADFGGYATKSGIKCSDGRTIKAGAFAHMDGMTVPLVWQHGHDKPTNVLGHAVLSARPDGVYAECYLNKSDPAKHVATLIEHGDVDSLSIYANQLKEVNKVVSHGVIREVSVVISGANSKAKIDQIRIQHADGDYEDLDDEAIIHMGLELDFDLAHAEDGGVTDETTIEEIFSTFTQEQLDAVAYVMGLEEAKNAEPAPAMAQSATTVGPTSADGTAEETTLTHQEGNTTVTHVYEQTATGQKAAGAGGKAITHSDLVSLFDATKKSGSFKEAFSDFVIQHGITDIETLFPDPTALSNTPEWDKRRTEWVSVVLGGVHKTPFSRIKTLSADLTLDEARAKGYVKGNMKKEEYFSVSKRTTGPTTVYKKQKLDRDDIIDISEFDVVAWMWGEIRLMLEEEVAGAILVGDGREVDDEDHIQDPVGATSGNGIRSILNDHDYYAQTFNVNILDANSTYMELVEAVLRARRFYKGTGQPTMFTTEATISELLLLRDGMDRRYFRTVEELATEMRVARIVPVEIMETRAEDVLAILVNLDDYNVGTNKGGEFTQFDQFDIDFNQHKYLLETRLSGALTKLKSAQIFKSVASNVTVVTPAVPDQDGDEVTITNTTGVTYKVMSFEGNVTYNGSAVAVDTTVTASFPIVIPDGGRVRVKAYASSASYALKNTVEDEWEFTYRA